MRLPVANEVATTGGVITEACGDRKRDCHARMGSRGGDGDREDAPATEIATACRERGRDERGGAQMDARATENATAPRERVATSRGGDREDAPVTENATACRERGRATHPARSDDGRVSRG